MAEEISHSRSRHWNSFTLLMKIDCLSPPLPFFIFFIISSYSTKNVFPCKRTLSREKTQPTPYLGCVLCWDLCNLIYNLASEAVRCFYFIFFVIDFWWGIFAQMVIFSLLESIFDNLVFGNCIEIKGYLAIWLIFYSSWTVLEAEWKGWIFVKGTSQGRWGTTSETDTELCCYSRSSRKRKQIDI